MCGVFNYDARFTESNARLVGPIVVHYLEARDNYLNVVVDAIEAQRACSSMPKVLAAQKLWALPVTEAEDKFDEVVDALVCGATELEFLELLMYDELSDAERHNLYRCRQEFLVNGLAQRT